MTTKQNTLAIILAAGEGTRMKSATPKVMHKVAHLSMLGHVIKAVQEAGIENIATIVGPVREDVALEAKTLAPQTHIFEQTDRLGTAHAVLCAKSLLEGKRFHIVVLFADTPLLSAQTIEQLIEPLNEGAAVVVAGFKTDTPHGYGRLLMKGNQLEAIREEKDTSDSEKTINLCNAGLMALHKDHAFKLLNNIKNNNAKSEFYLTDAVELASKENLNVRLCLIPEEDVMGVNDRAQLAQAEAIMQNQLRTKHLLNGVGMQDPSSIYFAHDTQIESDVSLENNITFGPDVTIQSHATIHAYCHIEGATIASKANIGPFARLRPQTNIGENVRIGNFVEVKKSSFAKGAKANHLSYIGDANVGESANIGAGTITCNYDGLNKFNTTIGKNAFIGSNTALVAPVSVGAGALVGAGSVITQDVPDGALALARGIQVNKNRKN